MSIDLSNPSLQAQAKAWGAEIAIATVYTGIACLFAQNRTVRILIIAKAVFALSINFICRGIKSWVDHTRQRSTLEIERFLLKVGGVFLNVVCAMQLASVDQYTRNVLVHEGGHALTGLVVFANAYPKVQITGPAAGSTEMLPINVNKPIVGFKGSEFLYTAGGPIASLCSVVVMVAIAHFWGDAYDGFDQYLYEAAGLTAIQHIEYARTSSLSSSHDFGSMAKMGMPQWIWVALFVLVPLLTLLLLFVYDETIGSDGATLSDGESAGEEVVVNV